MIVELSPQEQKRLEEVLVMLTEQSPRQMMVSKATGLPPNYVIPDDVAQNDRIMYTIMTLFKKEGILSAVMYHPDGTYLVCEPHFNREAQ